MLDLGWNVSAYVIAGALALELVVAFALLVTSRRSPK